MSDMLMSVNPVDHPSNKKDHNYEIDLDYTDGDSSDEEVGPDEYENDGLLVFGENGLTLRDIQKIEADVKNQNPLEISADKLWYTMMVTQVTKWCTTGRNERIKQELEYKLKQFRTDAGKQQAKELAEKYNLNY